MGISQKLHTKLVQKLILTPSLQQAIKLLPMSTLELSDLLNQEMVENPMLEEVPTEELQPAETQPEKQETEEPAPKTDAWDDSDYEYFFGDYLDDGYRPRTPQEVKELPPIENTLSTSTSLADHLVWQLSLQTDDDAVREIGMAIVGNLDDDGYLVASVDEIAAKQLARLTLTFSVGTATLVMLLTSVIAWITVKTKLPGRAFGQPSSVVDVKSIPADGNPRERAVLAALAHCYPQPTRL